LTSRGAVLALLLAVALLAWRGLAVGLLSA
jgi:hypothetical protein